MLHHLRQQIAQFTIDRNWQQFHTLKNLTTQLAVEAIELVQAFEYNEGSVCLTAEAGDVLNNILLICINLEWDLGNTLPSPILDGKHGCDHAHDILFKTRKLLEIFLWLTPEQSATLSPKKTDEVKSYLTSILQHLVQVAAFLDIDLYQAAQTKHHSNRQKYGEQANGRADKYTTYAQQRPYHALP